MKTTLITISSMLLMTTPSFANSDLSGDDFGYMHGHFLIANYIANSQILAVACNHSQEGKHVDDEARKVIKGIFDHVSEHGKLRNKIDSFYKSPRYTWQGLKLYATEFLKTGEMHQILLTQHDFKYVNKETDLDLDFITDEFYKTAVNRYAHKNCDDNLKAGALLLRAALDFNSSDFGGVNLLLSLDDTFDIDWNVSKELQEKAIKFMDQNFNAYNSAYHRFIDGYEHKDYVHVYDRYGRGYLKLGL